MFALEISFQDGVSQPETIFIRRPQALIGGSDSAHVVIEDMASLSFQLRLVRDLGRTFRLIKVGPDASVTENSDQLYENTGTFDLGPVKLVVTALDSDLLVKDSEPPDRAGVRVLRQAAAVRTPLFPAVYIMGSPPMVISFDRNQPIYIGRAKQCTLRLDAADVSAQHARMGYEAGDFWIEDLGSTNGTFFNQQQISGRVSVAPVTPIVIGREISIMGVTSEDQINRIQGNVSTSSVRPRVSTESRYPVLVSVSEVARPARLMLHPGSVVQIGRDPASDMWLGAPHVSRMHSQVSMTDGGEIVIVDRSTNGTGYEGGVLQKGESITVAGTPTVLDFGGGVTAAICFDEEQERTFLTAQGSAQTFAPPAASPQRPAFDPKFRRSTGQIQQDEFLNAMEEASEGLPSWMPSALVLFFRFYRSMGTAGKVGMIAMTIVALVLIVVVSNLLITAFI